MTGKRICVLYGGRSLERDVSLSTGHRVGRALESRGYQVTGIDVDESLVRRLIELRPEVAFIAMHGKGGEDGTVQELLEILRIPYTGSGVLSSIRAMDKVLTKHILKAGGIPTPPFHAFNDAAFREMGAKDTLQIIAEDLGLPVVVKPAAQGSALGIKFAAEARDLPAAMVSALSFDRKVLLERFVAGRELAVSILGTAEPRVLPIVEAIPQARHSYYDFESRYTPGETDFEVPAELAPEVAAEVERLALATYRALGCRGFGRVDFILDQANRPWVLELNTIPGLTETSTMPLAAQAAGLSFEDLVVAITESATL
ncbi:MAG: D-alanine--D-alanine ligase [Thermoleophilia bacterium]|nr:D-alanine--D-alanine ligase [Thermoleophilia bacterium]